MPVEANTTYQELIFVPDVGHPNQDQANGGKVYVDGNIIEENRGYDNCKAPMYMFCDINDTDRRRNDVTSAWRGGDTVSFKLFKEDGTLSAYTPAAVAFVNQANAFYCTIEWRDVMVADSVITGCYTLETTSTIASVTQYVYNWGIYNVQPYEIGTEINPILLTASAVRILSEFNSMNDWLGLDFTGSRVLDTARLDAKFGYFNDNSEEDNIEYLNGNKETIKNEDFTEYELRLNLSGYCHVEMLRLHLLCATYIWASDWSFDAYDYLINDRPVIVKEGLQPEHFDGSRQIKGVVRFEDKVNKRRTHFQNNRITAQEDRPPILCPIVAASASSTLYAKSAQTTSYRTDDDGDLEIGRGSTFFVLSSNNPAGNTNRWTDELGGQTYTNNIIIDWDQRDIDGGTVLGYYRVSRVASSWADAIDTSAALSIGAFTTGWFLPNIRQMVNLYAYYATPSWAPMGWAPLSLLLAENYWSSTSRPIVTSHKMCALNNSGYGQTVIGEAGATTNHISARIFTLAELGF